MSKRPSPHLFIDSSALFAGVVSADGASRALLSLAAGNLIIFTVSEQVISETERALVRKARKALLYYREAMHSTGLHIVRDPSPEEVAAHRGLISHQPDVPIVLAAKRAVVDYLMTLNRRHFIDDPGVSVRSELRIGTPGEALAWVREYLARQA